MKFLPFLTQLTPIVLLIVATVKSGAAAKILVLLPIATHSEKSVFEPLVRALALDDHDVTVVSPDSSNSFAHSVKEIHPTTVEELGYGITGVGKDLLKTRKELISSTQHFLPVLWNTTLVDYGCRQLYEDVEIKYLMKGFTKFDLAIVNGINNECALGLVSFFRVPHIYLMTMAAPNYVIARFGHYFPTSFVPSPYLEFDDSMTFFERCTNFLVETLLVLIAKLYLYPHYEEIYREYVGQETPGIEEIDDTVGVILMNSNFVMSHKRPLVPNVIEIGCLHCRIPHSLPTEMDMFLNEAEDGFIYCNLGSMIPPEDMPQKVLNLLLKVFSKLDELVIWKWDEPIPNLPDNVRIEHWLPQQDMLGHENIKLFISNGDIQSTQEAIFHGVPLLGIPITLDDDLNLKSAERAGYALTWEISDLNATKLEELIYTITVQPQFEARVKHLSRIHREIPGSALKKAEFWVDYVLRNKGAPELRSPSKDLNYFQYHSLDVILFIATLLLLLIFILSRAMSGSSNKTTLHFPTERINGSAVKNKCD